MEMRMFTLPMCTKVPPAEVRAFWGNKRRVNVMVPEAGIEPARLAARDFRPTSAFAAHAEHGSWAGARLHHSPKRP